MNVNDVELLFQADAPERGEKAVTYRERIGAADDTGAKFGIERLKSARLFELGMKPPVGRVSCRHRVAVHAQKPRLDSVGMQPLDAMQNLWRRAYDQGTPTLAIPKLRNGSPLV